MWPDSEPTPGRTGRTSRATFGADDCGEWLWIGCAPYVLRDAVLAGCGVAMLPEWLVARDVAKGRLTVLLPGYETPPVTVTALHRVEQRRSPRVLALVEHLTDAYRREDVKVR